MAISIECDKEEYSAGDTVWLTVRLELDEPVKARTLNVRLYCTERKKTVTKSWYSLEEMAEKKALGLHMDTPAHEHESVDERVLHSQEKDRKFADFAESGTYEFEFVLPQDAAPTSEVYGHDNKTDVWIAHAKLDIPFAPDLNAEIRIFVKGL
jgi:hypothetical protein